MAEKTGINWADSTFNPWIGCEKVSPGCDNCYAERSTPSRTLGINWGPRSPRKRTSASNWNLPKRWDSGHSQFFQEHGRRRRVFCASLSDVFDNRVDPKWREDLWDLVRSTPNLTWLILTKRIGNAPSMLPVDWDKGYPNVWLGITVVNQLEVDRDVPKLLAVPSTVRWLSMEPLLSAVTLLGASFGAKKVDWAVVGGESGKEARPMEEVWATRLASECEKLRISFFFKQLGGVGKAKGGDLLGGRVFKTWPLMD